MRNLLLPLVVVVAPVLLPAGAPREFTLDSNKPLKQTLAPADSHRYVLNLTAGQFLEIDLIERDADFVIRVQDDAGQPIDVSDPRLLWIASASGPVRIEIDGPPRRSAPVHYTIVRRELRASTPADTTKLAAQELIREGGTLEN